MKYNEKQDCYELFAVNSLVSLWISLYHIVCKNGSAPVVPAKNFSDTITQKQMLQFVQAYYFEKLSLKAIADSGNISRTKCLPVICKISESDSGGIPAPIPFGAKHPSVT